MFPSIPFLCRSSEKTAAVVEPPVVEPYVLERSFSTMSHVEEPENDGLPVINRVTLTSLTGGDTDFEKVLLGLFYETAPETVHELSQAMDDVDFNNVVYRAHTLKGSAKSIGADRTAISALEVETLGKNQDAEALPLAYAKLSRRFDELLATIDKMLQEG